MTRTTLGDAIRDARESYGKRVGHPRGRSKLSAEDLYTLCQASGGPEHFRLIVHGGRSVIEGWEHGRQCPTDGQRRVLEKVLHLQSGELDEYPSREQLLQEERRSGPAGRRSVGPVPQPPSPTTAAAETATAAPAGEWLDALGGVDPVLEPAMRAAPGSGRRFALPFDSDAEDGDIAALRKAVRSEPRLVVVTGQAFLGKKAKIKGMLRLIAERSDSLTYELADEDGTVMRLPIRAWSARRLHYREMVERVHDFLEQYQAGRTPLLVPPLPMREQRRPLDELIEGININFRDCPAVFIFTDVDAFGVNHVRNVVRDLGIEQLIRTLLDANKASRIIISTSDFEARSKRNRQLVNFPKHQMVQIGEPHLSEVRHFVRGDIRDTEPLLLLYDRDVRVRGDDLVAAAALINLTFDARSGEWPKEAKATIDRFSDSDPAGRDAIRGNIYRQIVDAVADVGLLHPLALVAASEDGLRPDTMRLLLGRWSQHDGGAVQFEDDAAADAELAGFAAKVGTRFLRRGGIARYDEEEYEFHERHRDDDLVWEIDPIISMYFLEALRALNPKLLARAHRLIALGARLRSQQKKVMMRSPIGSRASEEGSRDIQSYVNLLASIQYDVDAPPPVVRRPLRLSEAQVYAIDDSFSASLALRFAVFCLLKEDIDRDHRLTMIFDEDALRLDLFLLLFQDLGRLYAPDVDTLSLPKTLPDHLTGGIFSPEEVLDLMSTVGLSAFHAQRSNVVDEVVALAREFASVHGIPLSSIHLSRIWCCKVDASMRRGCWSEDDASSGHLPTWKFVRDSRRSWYPDLAEKVPRSAIREADLSRHKAHLRLLIREADLATLVEADRAVAERLYEQVRQIEAALSVFGGQNDPVVLSGRAARRYIQFLLQDPALRRSCPGIESRRNEVLEQVEALLSVNKSRLRRFSGGDRVGVMLDMARLRSVVGDFSGANYYAESAKRRAFSGSVSHGGKLDVYQVLAEVKLGMIEHGAEPAVPPRRGAGQTMKDAATAVRNLRAIAEHFNYGPSRAVAHALEARIALVADTRSRGRGGAHRDHYLRDARRAISAARDVAASLRQVNLAPALDAMDQEIRERRREAGGG